jgi:hypothetical protein
VTQNRFLSSCLAKGYVRVIGLLSTPTAWWNFSYVSLLLYLFCLKCVFVGVKMIMKHNDELLKCTVQKLLIQDQIRDEIKLLLLCFDHCVHI